MTFCSREDALEAQKELNDKRTLVGVSGARARARSSVDDLAFIFFSLQMNRPMQIRLTEQEAKAGIMTDFSRRPS